ncbi:hypothetical protein ADL06_18715 [Streptomyces sp. NRRL F-6491]|nr:hypothetical protein ADL06_18715 [Streptomyces sp. NRRL F-6491]KOX41450.1 hypothetical protein ADL08_18960 [Streptomyces sp. NRRL F-6492]
MDPAPERERDAAGATGSSASREGRDEDARDGGRRIDDATAERIAREAWDAVSAATPPPPDPGTDRAPARGAREPAEVTELRGRAIAVARGLHQLGYHLDETLLPGPDMAAG